jgi:hypothetical protein
MALNFPDSPTLNQVYTDTTSGFSYQWDGVVWQSYTPSSSSQIKIIDDISGSFNGVTDTFALAVSSVSLTPANAQQLRVVLGGIVQEPSVDYTVSGSNIIFTTPPSGGLDCSIVSLGPAVPVNAIEDGTVTPAKLSTGGPSWNTDGDVVITGTGTTTLLVNGNARVTGILTVGTSSLTLNGNTNQINGVTISSGIITATGFVGNLTGTATGLTGTPDITVGNLTATGNVSIGGTLTYEDVTNVDSVGLITARSGINVSGGSIVIDSGDINVSGVVTATTFVGNLTGTASTATASATAYSLTGTPTLNVGIVTVTGLDGVAYAGITSTAISKTLINREYCTVVAAGVTITLPSSPQPGWEVGIAVDNFTDVVVAGNGSNIMALNEDFTMDIAYLALQFVYIDSVQGWRYF